MTHLNRKNVIISTIKINYRMWAMINHTFYNTKNIDGFTYDMEEQVLQVTFKSGIKYNYYKVFASDVLLIIDRNDKEVPNLKRFKYEVIK